MLKTKGLRAGSALTVTHTHTVMEKDALSLIVLFLPLL